MWIFLIIVAVIAVIGLIAWRIKVSYERKVDDVKNVFLSLISKYTSLVSVCFEVQTNGKKIQTWDEQHKIDFIINKNKDAVLEALKLYNEFAIWWGENGEKVVSKINSRVVFLANNMSFLGKLFQRRMQIEIDKLKAIYYPDSIKFRLRTFTYHNNTRHYNPNTREWWCDSSPIQSTFCIELTPDDISNRVQVLAQYNFEMTEFQYNCDNQRKFMTDELRRRIIARDNGVCQICGKNCSPREIEIDHIQPVSKGGKTTESNLQVLCLTCNRQKSNKWMEEMSHDIKVRQSKTNRGVVNEKKNEQKQLVTKSDAAQVGDKIRIKDLEENEEWTFELVGNGQESSEEKISISDPIGKAVCGRIKGEIREVNTGSKIFHYQILEIFKRDE